MIGHLRSSSDQIGKFSFDLIKFFNYKFKIVIMWFISAK